LILEVDVSAAEVNPISLTKRQIYTGWPHRASRFFLTSNFGKKLLFQSFNPLRALHGPLFVLGSRGGEQSLARKNIYDVHKGQFYSTLIP